MHRQTVIRYIRVKVEVLSLNSFDLNLTKIKYPAFFACVKAKIVTHGFFVHQIIPLCFKDSGTNLALVGRGLFSTFFGVLWLFQDTNYSIWCFIVFWNVRHYDIGVLKAFLHIYNCKKEVFLLDEKVTIYIISNYYTL